MATEIKDFIESRAGELFEHAGLKCAIVDISMPEIPISLSGLRPYQCGYVQVPDFLKSEAEDYDKFDENYNIEIHGGLTYGDKNGWVGFDDAHSYKCLNVKKETKKLAEQIAKIERSA